MFKTIESKPNLIGAYLAQLICVPIVVGLLALPIVLVYDRLTNSYGRSITSAYWDAAGVVFFLIVGCIVGRLLAGRIESLVPTGLWVWLPAMVTFVLDFVGAWFNPWEHDEALSMAFRSVGGHEGMMRAIGTDPTLSLTGYSLGLYLAVRGRRRRTAEGVQPPADSTVREH
jgi:hypothetical protein